VRRNQPAVAGSKEKEGRTKMNEESNVNLLDERAAAQMLACSVALLRKMRLFGNGPGYCKIGRLVRYPETDLMAFIDANRVEGATHR
jgi:hypothetical protein